MAASDWNFLENFDLVNSVRTIEGGAQGQPGVAASPDLTFTGEYARTFHNGANNLEGTRAIKGLVAASKDGGKYVSVPAGKFIDQRFVVRHNRVLPRNPGILGFLYLCCKTEAVLSRPPETEDGYYLRYAFDGSGVFEIDLLSGVTVLENAIAGATIGDNTLAHLRLQVTDETTQDRIEVFQEGTLGADDWNLLHTELVSTASGSYRPWGVTSANRNGYAYANTAGINWGSSEASLMRYSIDVDNAP